MSQTIKLPSIPVWDAHWNTEALRREQATNPRSFSRGFQQRAFDDAERMFPSFSACFTPGIQTIEIARRGWPVFAGVDLAGPKRPGNVIFVAAVDPSSQRRYPLEVLVGAWKSPELAGKLAEVNARHPNLRVIMVENNGYQQSLIDWIQASPGQNDCWFKIEPYTTGFDSKANPTYGMPGMEVEFHNRAWVIPSGEFEGHPAFCPCGWCTWKIQTLEYPHGAQTDAVMAMFFCREAISFWGSGTTAGVGGTVGGVGGLNMR